MGNFMKTKIFVGLCVALCANFISVRADDTGAQAAARAALEQKLNELDSSQTQPPPAPVATSEAVVAQPGKSATNVTGTVPANAVTPQTAPAATIPVAAPAAAPAPAAAAPAAATPAAVAPAIVAPAVVAPAATARAVAAPTVTQPVAAATPRPTPAPAAAKSSSPPAEARPTNEIATVSGAIYKNARVEKVEPNGITVSYTPAGGGIGAVKINFDELSDEWRQQYGFDPQKKKEYEKEQIRAAAWWREQMITNYEAAVARRQAQEKAEAEAEAQAKEEREKAAAEVQQQTPEAQKAAAEAAAAMAVTNQPQTNVIQPPPQ
jgi:hypothetical protein